MLLELDGDGPRYAQVARALRASILNGDYPPGSKMPSIREFASDLGVSRIVIDTAYDALAADGLLIRRTGAGTYVADHLTDDLLFSVNADKVESGPEVAITIQSSPYLKNLHDQLSTAPFLAGAFHKKYRYDLRSLWAGVTPEFLKVWKRLASKCVENISGDHEPTLGAMALRNTLADYFAFQEKIIVSPEQIFIHCGRTSVLDMIAKCFLGPGSVALVEDPGYLPFYNTIAAYGARLVYMPVDENGFDIKKVSLPSERCNVVLFSTASHQYPTGAVMPVERKKSILEWAAERDAIVVDDPCDSEFRFRTPHIPSFKSLDSQDRVFHLTSLSYNLFPGLGLTVMIVPKRFAGTLRTVKMYTEYGVPYFNQYVAGEFISRGEYGKHLRRTRNLYQARRAILVRSLRRHFGEAVTIADSGVGRFIPIWFDPIPAERERDVIRRAEARDMALSGLAMHYRTRPKSMGLVLSIAQIDETEIDEAISLLGEIVDGVAPAAPKSLVTPE